MSDYSPSNLARKWGSQLPSLSLQTEQLWSSGKPKKRLFSFGFTDKDTAEDQMMPNKDKHALFDHGSPVFGHFARAFMPAYIPGKNPHYGSVVYSADRNAPSNVFALAWRINQLRELGFTPPQGTESIARAISDDQSDFSRLELPLGLGVATGCYFGNICIHRSRLPLGYLHTRLVPILIAPEQTPWCCILPLRFWPEEFKRIWSSENPAANQVEYTRTCKSFNIEP